MDTWTWIASLGVATALVVVVILPLAAGRRRRARYVDAARRWRETRPAERAAVLRAMLNDAERSGANAPVWYLLGCTHLRDNETKAAARAFGMAHHADVNLESAALLTFACLKAEPDEGRDILEQIVRTWNEMQRPQIGRRRADRLMHASLESTTRDPPGLSPLGRLAWLVVSPAQQSRLESLMESRSDGWHAALCASAGERVA